MFDHRTVGDFVFPVSRDGSNGDRGVPLVLAGVDDAEDIITFCGIPQTEAGGVNAHTAVFCIGPANQSQTARTIVAVLRRSQLLATESGEAIGPLLLHIGVLHRIGGQIIFEPDHVLLDEFAVGPGLEAKPRPVEMIGRVGLGRAFETGEAVNVEVAGPSADGIEKLSRSHAGDQHSSQSEHQNDDMLAHLILLWMGNCLEFKEPFV